MATTRERVRGLSEQGLSVREIASALQVSTQAVYKHLSALGIDPPTRRDTPESETLGGAA